MLEDNTHQLCSPRIVRGHLNMVLKGVRLVNFSHLNDTAPSNLDALLFANVQFNALKAELLCAVHSQSQQNSEVIVSTDLCA